MISMGASELAVAAGLQRTHADGTPYTSGITLWSRLSGFIPRYDASTSPDAEIGKWGEYAVAVRYAEERGFQWGTNITRGPTLDMPGFSCPEIPWLHVRPDLAVSEAPGSMMPVECKFPRELDPERWGEPGTDQVPGEHAAQIMGQLAVFARLFGSTAVELAAMARAPRGRQRVWGIYRMERDERLESGLLTLAWEWMETYVLGGRCPPPDGSQDADRTLRLIWPAVAEKKRVATPEDIERLRRLLQVREAQEEIRQRLAELRQTLVIGMEDATELVHPDGHRLATHRTGRDGRKRFRVIDQNIVWEDDSQ